MCQNSAMISICDLRSLKSWLNQPSMGIENNQLGPLASVSKPNITCIHDDFIPQFTWDKMVCAEYNFHLFFLLQHYGKYWSTARNIRDNEALQNLMKISKWIDLVSLDLLAWQIVYMYLQLPKYFSMSSSFCDDLYFAIIFIYCKK